MAVTYLWSVFTFSYNFVQWTDNLVATCICSTDSIPISNYQIYNCLYWPTYSSDEFESRSWQCPCTSNVCHLINKTDNLHAAVYSIWIWDEVKISLIRFVYNDDFRVSTCWLNLYGHAQVRWHNSVTTCGDMFTHHWSCLFFCCFQHFRILVKCIYKLKNITKSNIWPVYK